MFKDCISLSIFPDVSKQDTRKMNYMGNLVKGCSSLPSIRDISKWNCLNLVLKSDIYRGCLALLYKPKIKKEEFS